MSRNDSWSMYIEELKLSRRWKVCFTIDEKALHDMQILGAMRKTGDFGRMEAIFSGIAKMMGYKLVPREEAQ